MADSEKPKIYTGEAIQSEGSETDNLPQEIHNLARQAVEMRFKDRELLAKILGMKVSFIEFPPNASIRGAVVIGDDVYDYEAEYYSRPCVEKVIVEKDKKKTDVFVVTGLGVTLESASAQNPPIQISLIRPVIYDRGELTGVRVEYGGSSKNLACSLPEGLNPKNEYTVNDGIIICFTPEALGVLSQSGIEQGRPNFLYAIKVSPPLKFTG